jgi:hypothetical protein
MRMRHRTSWPYLDLDDDEPQAPATVRPPRRGPRRGAGATIGAAFDQGPAAADRRVSALLRLGRSVEDLSVLLRLTPAEVRAADERVQRIAEGVSP